MRTPVNRYCMVSPVMRVLEFGAMDSIVPTVETKRLRLRWIDENDLEQLFGIFSNEEVMRYWSSPPLKDRLAAQALLQEIHEGVQQRSFLKWGLALRADDELIGTATLFHLEMNHKRAELGYVLGREHWGNGYIHEALPSLLDYAFYELHLHRLEADVDPRNARSIKTLERLGFRREGYLRERWHVNGEIQDALFYGLLLPEWKQSAASQ